MLTTTADTERAAGPRATGADQPAQPHELKLPLTVLSRLRCPCCRGQLRADGEALRCLEAECATRFPVVDGIPVLINEQRSVFAISDFLERRATTFSLRPRPFERLLAGALDRLPSISHAVNADRNYARLGELLASATPVADVLVVGGSVLGAGMETFASNSSVQLIATDVSFGPCTAVICDAHDLPFADGSFDGVVVQAVLEHVVDPTRCVEEIHRVLKGRGVVYAETPFMQQVHMGPYDFTRFTHSGHRRLFRWFEEVESGAVCGPGMALAWAYQYFLLSFATSRLVRGLLRGFASLTAFPLKYVDHYLLQRRGAIDAASGCYFIGRKSEELFTDRDLIRYYKGAVGVAK